MPQTKGGKVIQSVQRAIDIIECFDGVDIELSLSQISQRLGLNKSTVHGILNTLHNNDYICQNSDGKYLLGQALFNKGQLARPTTHKLYVDVAKPYMQALCDKYKVTSNLFIMEKGLPIVLHQILPNNNIYIIHHVSDNDPLYCTASGKIALAYFQPDALETYLAQTELAPTSSFTITTKDALRISLQEILDLGYSYEKEELGEGVSAISVPVFNKDGNTPFGAISITGVTFHIVRNFQAMVADIKQASKKIAQELL